MSIFRPRKIIRPTNVGPVFMNWEHPNFQADVSAQIKQFRHVDRLTIRDQSHKLW
jgi:hypothetical protein